MAVTNVDPVEDVTARLLDLLRRATQVKPQTSIDPPLQVSELAEGDGPLLGAVTDDREGHMSRIERAARNVFYSLLNSSRINDPSFVHIWNLLDILNYFGDHNECLPQLVMLLIEELLDSQTIDGCRKVFNFLESRREIFIATNSKSKDLVILRLGNELLRRLSRAEDSVFCGRVYIFLFQSFPLGNRSSVNLRGEFHTENITTFEDYLATSAQEDGDVKMDDVPEDRSEKEAKSEEATAKPAESEQTAEKKPRTMDVDALYPVFWSLQHSFSNPRRLFDEANFKEFRTGLEATLAKFKEVPKVTQTDDSEGKRDPQTEGEDRGSLSSTFNPKYLTSRDLFKLELSDLAFQRHILGQALILIDYLFSLTEKAKTKSYYVKAQKAMQEEYTLSEQNAEWALGIKSAIANYLQEGPDGKFYYRMVDTVLSRDKNWVRWKMENCASFTRDRVNTDAFLDAKKKGLSPLELKNFVSLERSEVGQDLTFLPGQGREAGLERLKKRKRRSQERQVTHYVTRAEGWGLDAELSAGEPDLRDGYEENQRVDIWRALRLASKTQLNAFDKLEDGTTKHLARVFLPAKSSEGADHTPEHKAHLPQEKDQSVEEQRAEDHNQETAATPQ